EELVLERHLKGVGVLRAEAGVAALRDRGVLRRGERREEPRARAVDAAAVAALDRGARLDVVEEEGAREQARVGKRVLGPLARDGEGALGALGADARLRLELAEGDGRLGVGRVDRALVVEPVAGIEGQAVEAEALEADVVADGLPGGLRAGLEAGAAAEWPRVVELRPVLGARGFLQVARLRVLAVLGVDEELVVRVAVGGGAELDAQVVRAVLVEAALEGERAGGIGAVLVGVREALGERLAAVLAEDGRDGLEVLATAVTRGEVAAERERGALRGRVLDGGVAEVAGEEAVAVLDVVEREEGGVGAEVVALGGAVEAEFVVEVAVGAVDVEGALLVGEVAVDV